MNKLLLTALTATVFAGSGLAYQQSTPSMMRAALEPVSSRTLPSGETEITLGFPVKQSLDNVKGSFNISRFETLNTSWHSYSTRAEEEEPFMDFTYAGSPQGYFGLNNMDGHTPVYMMVYFPEYYTRLFNNCRLKNLCFYSSVYGEPGNVEVNQPVNRIATADLFVAKEQFDIPYNYAYVREGCRLSTQGAVLQTLDFTEDYIIKEGETFFIGYSLTPLTSEDAFLWFDGQPVNNNDGALVGIGNSTGEPLTSENWMGFGREYGNLCIYVTVVGENLPVDGAQIYTMDIPMQVNVGEEFNARVDVINMNSNPIKTIEYIYAVGDSEVQTVTYELPEPLPYSQVLPITVSGVKSDKANLNIPFKFKITKVNGNDNYYENASVQMSFNCFDIENGFEAFALVESGTATWNGLSPMTISMMDYVTDEYSDYYHLATLHFNSEEEVDEMYVPSVDSMVEYFENLPMSYINRWANFYPGYFGTVIPQFKEEYGQRKAPVGIVSIETSTYENLNTTATTVEVKFALDMENKDRCRIGLYVTEDNVGKYDQANSFSGQQGNYDGWEKLSNPVRRQTYDNVVRYLAGGKNGIEQSLPEEIKAGETYRFTTELDLSKVKGEEFNIIAFVMDNESEEILNSQVFTTSKSADVEDLVVSSNAKVYGVVGGIAIQGEYDNVEIVSIDSKILMHPTGESFISLSAGIYIVKVDGKTSKVLVK